MEPMDTPHTMLGRFNFAVGEKTLYIAGGGEPEAASSASTRPRAGGNPILTPGVRA